MQMTPLMNPRIYFFILIFLGTLCCTGRACTAENSYHLALCDYFDISEQQVIDAKATTLSDEELPIVFFIAQRTNLGPESVTNVHSSGLNWMQVAFHFRLNPLIFYTFLSFEPLKTPFEKVYGEYKNRHQNFSLTDLDLINLVNLKFLSEYYGIDPKEIIQRHTSGKTYEEINADLWQSKENIQWDVNVQPISEITSTPTFHHQHKGSANGFTAPP